MGKHCPEGEGDLLPSLPCQHQQRCLLLMRGLVASLSWEDPGASGGFCQHRDCQLLPRKNLLPINNSHELLVTCDAEGCIV